MQISHKKLRPISHKFEDLGIQTEVLLCIILYQTHHSQQCVYRFYLSTFVYVDKRNVQQNHLFLSHGNDVQMYNITVFDCTASKRLFNER